MRAIKECRACKNKNLTEFLDLGEQYLSDFREDDSKPPKYPLVAVLCEDCKLVQLKHTTPQVEMYHERYGFKSGVNESIKKDLDDVVMHAFQYVNDPKSWLDIASNDGTLLSFIPELGGGWVVGVDPVEFLCREAQKLNPNAMILNDYFSNELLPFDSGYFDVITSVSCFYDMPNPEKFVQDVKKSLSPKGVWIIQQNYLMTTMELAAVDNFCHEHLEYYTLLSLENLLTRFGLEVNEVLISDINGGSIRTVVSHKDTFPIDESVQLQREREAAYGLDDIESYREFAEEVGEELNNLRTTVIRLRSEGNEIAILAASTRGATIWQSAEIGPYISYAVERNPAKVGRVFSAIGVPIISEEEFRKRQPDYAIVGPWFFAKEIIKRESEYKGKFIIPLPRVEIVSNSVELETEDNKHGRSRNSSKSSAEYPKGQPVSSPSA